MSEVVVRSIAHVSKIYDRAGIFPGGVNHLAERRIFVPFSGRLDHEIGKAPVEDGVKGINVELVKAPCGFAVRLKKVSGSSGFRKMSTEEPSQAMNSYFPRKRFLLNFPLKVKRRFARAWLVSFFRCL